MAPSAKFYIGQKIGMLTIINEEGRTNGFMRKFNCNCDCGKSIIKTTEQLTKQKSQSCGCIKMRSGKITQKPIPDYEDIKGEWWRLRIKSAKLRKYSWTITQEFVWNLFLKQDKKCYFSGESISFLENTASIDRLDNNKGYDPDNIALVHKHVNFMKQQLSPNDFYDWCEKITNNFKEKRTCY